MTVGRVTHVAAMTVGAALVTAALASAGYQMLGERRDRRRFPPPGELIDVDGRRLHLWRAGTGRPTVVIVAALSTVGLEWAQIQRELADR